MVMSNRIEQRDRNDEQANYNTTTGVFSKSQNVVPDDKQESNKHLQDNDDDIEDEVGENFREQITI